MIQRDCINRCNMCEMCDEDWEIVVIRKQGFSETRRVIPAVKCRRFGQVATTLVELPTSEQLDDFIYE